MNQLEILAAARAFAQQLSALNPHEVNLLLTPDNLLLGNGSITLRSTQPQSAVVGIYPGFSAPEVYTGAIGPATPVFFLGAVMHLLFTGAPPADAQNRVGHGPPLPPDSPLAALIDRALALDESIRFASLGALAEGLEIALQKTLALPPAPPQAGTPQPPTAAAPAVAPEPATQDVLPAFPQAPTPAPAQVVPAPAAPPTTPASAGGPPTSPPLGQASLPGATPAPYAPAPTQPGAYPAGQPQPAPPHPAAVSPPAAQPPAPPQAGAPPPPPPQKAKKSLLIGIAAAVALALGVVFFLGWTTAQRNNAETAFAAGNYADVVKAVNRAGWIKGDFQDEYNYSRARLLLAEGQREDALALLDGLGRFNKSDALANQTRYDMALGLLEDGDLKGSLALFAALEEKGFQDSGYYVTSIQNYAAAEALTDPLERYEAFTALDGFLDSEEKAQAEMDALVAVWYEEGLALYAAGDNDSLAQAAELLRCLPEGYEEVDSYVWALEIWENGTAAWSAAAAGLPLLRELSLNIDVGPVAMSKAFMPVFLNGIWMSEDGGGRLEWDWSARHFQFSDLTDRISGMYSMDGPTMKSSTDSPDFNFGYVDFDTVTVNLSTGEEFTFARTT